jgi:methyl-accepting chemotaxis protein
MLGVAEWFNLRVASQVEHVFDAKDLTADILPPPLYLVELRLVASEVVEGTLSPEQGRSEFLRLTKDYDQRWQHWLQNPLTGFDAALLQTQDAGGRKMMQSMESLLAAAPEARVAALTTVHAAYSEHRAAVDRTVQTAVALAAADVAQISALEKQAIFVELVTGVAAVLVLMGLALWVYRRVLALLGGEPGEVAEVARAVADGDLTVQVNVIPGDTGSVMAAMDAMCRKLKDAVSKIQDAGETISAGAEEIASGNMDLHHRTEAQAGNLQQTAAAMEQFSGTVKQTASAATEADRLAQSASQVASQGAKMVQGVVSSMEQISASSKKIAEITSVIDGIAFQTNILALNAAVEAARAGEQGRGFAVVASEVRSLAQRSAAAAKEINGLIQGSVATVHEGARQVGEAGAKMDEIVGQVAQVTSLIGEIASATGEQTSGIGLVSSSVSEMDGTTQQNAALVEESSAAATTLRGQAVALVEVARAFRV